MRHPECSVADSSELFPGLRHRIVVDRSPCACLGEPGRVSTTWYRTPGSTVRRGLPRRSCLSSPRSGHLSCRTVPGRSGLVALRNSWISRIAPSNRCQVLERRLGRLVEMRRDHVEPRVSESPDARHWRTWSGSRRTRRISYAAGRMRRPPTRRCGAGESLGIRPHLPRWSRDCHFHVPTSGIPLARFGWRTWWVPVSFNSYHASALVTDRPLSE
jgi:hypothetical protein